MKRYINKKFGTAFLGTLGAIVSSMVVVLMLSGDFQKSVHFAGIKEEMVFTLFVAVIGMISLGAAISCIINRE